jgi:hypothetical protein
MEGAENQRDQYHRQDDAQKTERMPVAAVIMVMMHHPIFIAVDFLGGEFVSNPDAKLAHAASHKRPSGPPGKQSS